MEIEGGSYNIITIDRVKKFQLKESNLTREDIIAFKYCSFLSAVGKMLICVKKALILALSDLT